MKPHTFTTSKGTELPFLNLKGKDYLQVAHRLVWFREEKPAWRIVTQVVKLDDDMAVVTAEIADETGAVKAVAHKMQAARAFPGGYLEKAESGAIGRALAFLGYGTTHAQELEEDEATPMEGLADTPQNPKNGAPENKAHGNLSSAPKITEAQAKRMFAIAKSKGWSDEEIKKIVLTQGGVQHSRDLTRAAYDKVCTIFERGPDGEFAV